MLSNGTMNEARSQTAQGRVVGDNIALPTPTSGVEYAKERLIQLGSMLGELEIHAEQQVTRLSGAVPLRDEGSGSDVYRAGTVGELHNVIDGLFVSVERIAMHAGRLAQV